MPILRHSQSWERLQDSQFQLQMSSGLYDSGYVEEAIFKATMGGPWSTNLWKYIEEVPLSCHYGEVYLICSQVSDGNTPKKQRLYAWWRWALRTSPLVALKNCFEQKYYFQRLLFQRIINFVCHYSSWPWPDPDMTLNRVTHHGPDPDLTQIWP